MPGPMVIIRTQIAANRLNIGRELNMGTNVQLRFCVPDQASTGGVEVIRTYEEAFNRVPEREREIGDGSAIVVDIADIFPEGQLHDDIEAAKFIQFVSDDVPSPLYGDLDVPAISESSTRVYRITARRATLKQTYFKAGHGNPRR